MDKEEIMSEEAFKELIDNLEIIEKLTPYGRKSIKYWVTKLQRENEDIKLRKDNQEKRFKKYKENIDKQHEEIYENLVSEKEKYKYLYQKALDNTVKADKESMQLKKQIDLMAEVIFKKFKAPLIIEYGIENKEQFIKIFEQKAKEKGE